MKIMHFISAPAAGGAEVYVKDLSIELAKQGHEVGITFIAHSSEIGRDDTFEELFLHELERNGIATFFLPFGSRSNPVKGLWGVAKILKQYKPDILHSHLHYGIIYCFPFRNFPLVYTHHSMLPGVNKLFYKFYNLRVSRYIGISDLCSNILEQLSGRQATTVVNAIDTERFAKRVREITDGDKIIMLTVGRMADVKNYDMLIEVANEIRKEHENFEIWHAGSGSDERRRALKEKIQRYDLEQHVRLLGECDDIPSLLDSADLFIMTSKAEGLPISLIEATCAGMPSIVTDVGGCREVVENCQSGFSVTPGNVGEFTQAVQEMIRHQGLMKQMSSSAIFHSRRYHITRCVKEHLVCYRQVLSCFGRGQDISLG
jgi:glycosyltransferase involved in cell wall biosynthesis